jgi:hypothetical protein
MRACLILLCSIRSISLIYIIFTHHNITCPNIFVSILKDSTIPTLRKSYTNLASPLSTRPLFAIAYIRLCRPGSGKKLTMRNGMLCGAKKSRLIGFSRSTACNRTPRLTILGVGPSFAARTCSARI